MNIFEAKVYIEVDCRKIRCNKCSSVKVEELDLVSPYEKITKRFAFILENFVSILL
jgi:transposase